MRLEKQSAYVSSPHPKAFCLKMLPLAAALACLFTTMEASAAEIWLSGVPPLLRPKMFQEPSSGSDYLDLFKPGAPWQKVSPRVKVFMTNGGLILRESDAVLQAVFADLKRRNSALAMEMGLVSGRDSTGKWACGVGIEGMAPEDTAKVFANRIKKNGGELAYVAMDEPLWWAHHFAGKNGCQYSIEALARNVAPRIKDLREIFPSVEIGDVEPVGAAQNVPPDWIDEIAQWTQVYQQVVGQKLSFFHADVACASPWQQQLAAVKRLAHERGLKFGVIYDGGGTGKQESDELWTQEALQRTRAVESNPATIPDHAIFQTWVRWPHNMLPEDRPGTMTWLVDQYVSSAR
jgi:hypothetical protein